MDFWDSFSYTNVSLKKRVLPLFEANVEYIWNFCKWFIIRNCSLKLFHRLTVLIILRKSQKVCYWAFRYYKGLHDRWFPENLSKFPGKLFSKTPFSVFLWLLVFFAIKLSQRNNAFPNSKHFWVTNNDKHDAKAFQPVLSIFPIILKYVNGTNCLHLVSLLCRMFSRQLVLCLVTWITKFWVCTNQNSELVVHSLF